MRDYCRDKRLRRDRACPYLYRHDVSIKATAAERYAGNLWKACLLRASVPEADIASDLLDALNDFAGLAVALREIGRIKRSLFTLDWIRNPALRRRANAGLNKGEARNALSRAIFFHRLGELRDRSFDSQVYRVGAQPAGRRRDPVEHAVYAGSLRRARP